MEDLLAHSLSWLMVSTWNWLRKLFGGTENTSAIVSADGASISGENEFAESNQTKPADTSDPLLKIRSRSTKAGAWAGLAGAIVGLLVVGFSLEYIVQVQSNSYDASPFAFIAGILCCSPYPLIGAAGGALIGRWSVKRDDDLEHARAVFRFGGIGGGIAGLIIGILPYVLVWLYFLR